MMEGTDCQLQDKISQQPQEYLLLPNSLPPTISSQLLHMFWTYIFSPHNLL